MVTDGSKRILCGWADWVAWVGERDKCKTSRKVEKFELPRAHVCGVRYPPLWLCESCRFSVLWFRSGCVLLYVALLCFTLLCCALPCFALLGFTLLCFALLGFTLLCFALRCWTLLCFALLCVALV